WRPDPAVADGCGGVAPAGRGRRGPAAYDGRGRCAGTAVPVGRQPSRPVVPRPGRRTAALGVSGRRGRRNGQRQPRHAAAGALRGAGAEWYPMGADDPRDPGQHVLPARPQRRPTPRRAAAAHQAVAGEGGMSGISPRCVVVGVDGLAFNHVLPLVERGLLPNLAALLADGAAARLVSSTPWQTPVGWTTYATGVNPGRHGVDGWAEAEPGSGALRAS